MDAALTPEVVGQIRAATRQLLAGFETRLHETYQQKLIDAALVSLEHIACLGGAGALLSGWLIRVAARELLVVPRALLPHPRVGRDRCACSVPMTQG